MKWFPDRRGLAVGMTAAGFGAGGGAQSTADNNGINGSSGSGAGPVAGPLLRAKAMKALKPIGVSTATRSVQ